MTEPTTEPVRPALRSVSAWALLLGVALVSLATDLGSKEIAFERVAGSPVVIERADVLASDNLQMLIPAHAPVTVVPSILEFTLVLNPGAVFGIGAGHRWLFVGFTIIALSFGMWIFGRWTTVSDRSAHIAIALLISGGLGNLYDRIVFGCVRDFIHPLPGVGMPFGLSWPGGNTELWPYVSNLADLYLLIGIGLLLLHIWRKPEPENAQDAEPSET